MIKIFLQTILVLFALFVGVANAELKVGVVDMSGVIQTIPQTQQGEKSLQDKFLVREKAMREKAQKFEQARKEFEKNRTVMNQSQQQQEISKLSQQAQSLQQNDISLRKEINAAREKFLTSLEQQLSAIIQKIAKAENFDIVYYSGVVYAKPKFDLTTRIIDEMKKKFDKAKK